MIQIVLVKSLQLKNGAKRKSLNKTELNSERSRQS